MEGMLILFYFILFFALLGFELKATLPALEPLHQPFFVMGFFEIGSHKLFA
jgi:hypothetical protein